VNVQRANFQDILRFYFERQTTKTATEVLEEMIAGRQHLQLANLLRDHRVKSVYSKRERYLRACVDDLLLCYNIFEIGALTQFIPKPDGSEFWQRVRVILENKQIRRYFEEFYPLRLPQLLGLRLQERYSQVESEDSAMASVMIQFLALDRGFMSNLNDSYLLSMLDSFTIQGYCFRDVVDLIAVPEKFIKGILIPPAKRSIPDSVIQELGQFFQFSVNLDELLQSLDGFALVQSEIWNHYSYWFERIGRKLSRKLGQALDQFLRWKPANSSDDAAREIQEYVGQARLVIETLTSNRYSDPVRLELLVSKRQAPKPSGPPRGRSQGS
jgi:hypothetical protein